MNPSTGRTGPECDVVRELLSEQQDRPLTPAETLRIGAHLPTCAGCGEFQRRLLRGMHGIGTLPAGAADPEVRAEVLRRLPGARRRVLLGQGLKLAGAAVAFGLIGLLLVTVLRPGAGDGADTQRSGAAGNATATLEALPAATAPLQPGNDPACYQPLSGLVADAQTISSTRNARIVWFRVMVDPTRCAAPDAATVGLSVPKTNGGEMQGGADNLLKISIVPGDAENEYVGSLLWMNWCGALESAPALVVQFWHGDQAGELQGFELSHTPGCDDPTQPTRLAEAPPGEPAPNWAVAEPVCGSEGVTWEIVTSSDADELLITAKPAPGSSDCRLTEDLVVTLLDANQQPLDIEGNGLLVPLTGGVPIPTGVFTLAWSNWCGATDDISVSVESPSTSSGMGPLTPPACTDPAQPSVLRDAFGPGSVDLPACDRNEYHYLLTMHDAAGTRYVVLAFVDADGRECVIAETYTVSIVNATDDLLEIDGNGSTYAVGGPGIGPAESWFAWSNWCGEPGAFRVDVQGRGGAIGQDIDPPPCTDPNAPSTITPSKPLISEPPAATATE